MSRTEHTYQSEAAAHAARRALISQGVEVTLIGYDTTREVFAFDSFCPEQGANWSDRFADRVFPAYCEHEHVRQVSEHDVECLDCGVVSA